MSTILTLFHLSRRLQNAHAFPLQDGFERLRRVNRKLLTHVAISAKEVLMVDYRGFLQINEFLFAISDFLAYPFSRLVVISF